MFWFSTAQTEKYLWKKFVKQIGEIIWWIQPLWGIHTLINGFLVLCPPAFRYTTSTPSLVGSFATRAEYSVRKGLLNCLHFLSNLSILSDIDKDWYSTFSWPESKEICWIHITKKYLPNYLCTQREFHITGMQWALLLFSRNHFQVPIISEYSKHSALKTYSHLFNKRAVANNV